MTVKPKATATRVKWLNEGHSFDAIYKLSEPLEYPQWDEDANYASTYFVTVKDRFHHQIHPCDEKGEPLGFSLDFYVDTPAKALAALGYELVDDE